MLLKELLLIYFCKLCAASYHEQYRVPEACSERWESYNLNDKEYIIQDLPVTYENARIMCRGQYNGSLAIVDTKEKADFLAEVLSESQLPLESVWVGARRGSAEDPAGYRWSSGAELRRTAADILPNEDEYNTRHYPLWVNRTRVPVPEGGADCVALERVQHDKPVFLDLSCSLDRGFVCQRSAAASNTVQERQTVRCNSGMYHVFDGKLDWAQAAAYCVVRKMALANIPTMKCLKKLGMTMLKIRPSIEAAWIGSKGELGRWWWVDTGLGLFQTPPYLDVVPQNWPPMREKNSIKQNGCLQLDRHASHPPVFLEARCERKMQFICYQASPLMKPGESWPSDDLFYYVLVTQKFYWQHAYENCQKMNGSLASIENSDVLLQLLLVMGENKEKPIDHIWISGRLNMSKDITTDIVGYAWYNPLNEKRIPDPKNFDGAGGLYMPPWLNEEFSLDSSCLNLDRQDHLNGLVYGLPCDTPQYSVCMIEKSIKTAAVDSGSESTINDVSS